VTPDRTEEESVTLPAQTTRAGLLANALDHWRTRGWDPATLTAFRMEADPEFAALPAEERAALEALDPADQKALAAAGLTADDWKALSGDDPRIRQARDEAAARRQELKPWKDLGREFGMTPEQAREALTAAKKPAPKEGEKPPVDEEAVKRAARLEAEQAANRRITKAELKVLARDVLADPDDAPLYLDLDKYEVDDDGLTAPDEALEDIKALAKRKPHLAKTPVKPKPDKGQGASGGKAEPGDAGRAYLEKRFGKKAAATK
jgi:hypothetical protein